MREKEMMKSAATVCLAAAVFLSCFFARCGDASRLTKTARRNGRKGLDGDTTGALREGRIVFGADSETGPDLKSLVAKTVNASEGDEAAYQADSAGWPKGHAQDGVSKEAKWRRMSPSLLCGSDQMKFRAIGPGASQLALAQGNASPLPLSNVPPSCGYSMQRNSMALVMVVPYDGCNVLQEGESYMLPLRWHGIPVLLLCSKPTMSSFTTTPPQTVGFPPAKPLWPQVHWMNPVPQQPFIPNPQYPSVFLPGQVELEKDKHTQQNTFYPPLYPFLPPLPPITTAAPAKNGTPNANPAAVPSVFHHSQMFPFHGFTPVPHGQWPIPLPPPGADQSTAGTHQGARPQLLPGQLPPGQWFFPVPFPGAVPSLSGSQPGAKPQLLPRPWPFPLPLPGTPQSLLGAKPQFPPGPWPFPRPLPGTAQSQPGAKPQPSPGQLPPGQWPLPLPLPGADPQLPPGPWSFPLPLPGAEQSQPGAKPQLPPGPWSFPLPLPGADQSQPGAKPQPSPGQLPPGQWPLPLPLPGADPQYPPGQLPPGQLHIPLPLPEVDQSTFPTQPAAKPPLLYYPPHFFPMLPYYRPHFFPMFPPAISPPQQDSEMPPTQTGTQAQPFLHPHHLMHNHPHSHLLQQSQINPSHTDNLPHSHYQHHQPQNHPHYQHAHNHPPQM